MKLTKNDIKQKRAELAEKILEIDAARKEKELIESLLADDFRENRDAYEIGIAVVTKSEQLSDNSGGDENKPVQANPVTVEAKAK